MYAIIATGGKQYKVAEGDIIRVEKLGAEDGAEITFDDVIAVQNDTELLFGDAVKNAAVKATVVKTDKAKRSLFTDISGRADIIRRTVTDSRTQKSRSIPSMLN